MNITIFRGLCSRDHPLALLSDHVLAALVRVFGDSGGLGFGESHHARWRRWRRLVPLGWPQGRAGIARSVQPSSACASCKETALRAGQPQRLHPLVPPRATAGGHVCPVGHGLRLQLNSSVREHHTHNIIYSDPNLLPIKIPCRSHLLAFPLWSADEWATSDRVQVRRTKLF